MMRVPAFGMRGNMGCDGSSYNIERGRARLLLSLEERDKRGMQGGEKREKHAARSTFARNAGFQKEIKDSLLTRIERLRVVCANAGKSKGIRLFFVSGLRNPKQFLHKREFFSKSTIPHNKQLAQQTSFARNPAMRKDFNDSLLNPRLCQ
jgi:hypothetical protein